MSTKCHVTMDGNQVTLHSPHFEYRLQTSAGLQIRSWKNRLAGYEIPISGSEIEMDIDAADRRIWIAGWKTGVAR